MIGSIHKEFTKSLLQKTNLPEAYIKWATAPDEDMHDWHRYKYHKLSSFNKLYYIYIQKYDMREALEFKYAFFVMLGHLWLDMLSGPLKVYNGFNVTVHHSLLDNIKKEGYLNTTSMLHKLITSPPPVFIEKVCTCFEELDINDNNIVGCVFFHRLMEETIGYNNKHEINIYDTDEVKYNNQYNEIIKIEGKILKYMKLYL